MVVVVVCRRGWMRPVGQLGGGISSINRSHQFPPVDAPSTSKGMDGIDGHWTVPKQVARWWVG